MDDVRTRLRRANEQVTPPDRAFERMVERRVRKRRTARVASASLALVLAVAVVGGSVALLSGLAGDRLQPASRGNIGLVAPDDEVSALQACIEGAGYDWDEVWPVWNSPKAPPVGSVFNDDAFWRAWEVCVVETGLVKPFSEQRIAAENHEVRSYVKCMRERGWNLPEPWAWEGPYHPGLLTPGGFDVPENHSDADRYYRDTADCGIPSYRG